MSSSQYPRSKRTRVDWRIELHVAFAQTTWWKADVSNQHRIRFLPMDVTLVAEEGETLLETAMRSGIYINASCGANGACGKCRITVKEGLTESRTTPKISEDDFARGVRLACTTRPLGDIVVEVPFESRIDRTALRASREAPHILSSAAVGRLVATRPVDPIVFKQYLELSRPTGNDNISDLGRLVRELEKNGVTGVHADFNVIQDLPRLLRQAGWRVTATLARETGGHKILKVEPGNTEQEHVSLAIDIGTTTVCARLIDIHDCRAAGRDIAACTGPEASDYNGQIGFGDDVISRIMYARKPDGLKKLQDAVVGTINGLIRDLLAEAHVRPESVSHLVCAGNTTMTHLLLGLDPAHIMLAPYTPVAGFFPQVRARDLTIELNDFAPVYIFPCVASYVGGDIVAGVLASGIFQADDVTLFIDVGTNGEIVVGNREWLTCTSCSAGPAFEGGGIEFGMRAGRGAIEQARINPVTFEPMLLTIGRTPPMGICGSGLIDLVAELFLAGLVDQNGRLDRDTKSARVRMGKSGWEYVVCYAEDGGIGRDIVLTEADLDNLLRAKAAVYAGCATLLRSVGLDFSAVGRIIIAGAFGHYLDVERAQTIGLLPDASPDTFTFIGNGSLLGARLFSLSKEMAAEADHIARNMTNIELADNAAFIDEYTAALFIPHTDAAQFRNVMARIRPDNGRGRERA